METLIIIPTYNEIENIELLTQELLQRVPSAHLLIVDDNSPDGTGEKADQLKSSQIHVLHREKKAGLGQAYIAAFQYAIKKKYEYIIQMDADFSHPPEYIPYLLNACQKEGADLCLGSRYIPEGQILGWSVWRRGLSYFGSLYARFWLRMPFRDLTGGFKCWKREVLENIHTDKVQSTGYCFQVELTYRAFLKKYKIVEIPITFPDRTRGKSKMSLSIAAEAAFRVPFMPFTVKIPTNKKELES